MQLVPPDADHLSRMMTHATAPAFILGAVAAFISVLTGRMTLIVERIRYLNCETDSDASRAQLKSDIPRLWRRATLLNSATHLALGSGICTSLLLVLGFVSAFLSLEHVYGVSLLFIASVAMLGASLFKFGQEVRIGLAEADRYR